MAPRRVRLNKVVTHRSRELDKSVEKLAEARVEAMRAEARREAARAELERAEAERLTLAQAPVDVEEWRAANEWLASREASHVETQRDVGVANAGVERTHASVLSARIALRSVELVAQKLTRAERRAEDVEEQKLGDEIAQKPRKKASRT